MCVRVRERERERKRERERDGIGQEIGGSRLDSLHSLHPAFNSRQAHHAIPQGTVSIRVKFPGRNTFVTVTRINEGKNFGELRLKRKKGYNKPSTPIWSQAASREGLNGGQRRSTRSPVSLVRAPLHTLMCPARSCHVQSCSRPAPLTTRHSRSLGLGLRRNSCRVQQLFWQGAGQVRRLVDKAARRRPRHWPDERRFERHERRCLKRTMPRERDLLLPPRACIAPPEFTRFTAL